MKTVQKSTVFPSDRHSVYIALQKIETLRYIASPYATFTPVDPDSPVVWEAGAEASFKLRLFGFIPFGVHTIHIEKFDETEGVSSREGNRHVPVWNHHISLESIDERHTKYTDRVEIDAGWKTPFVYAWAKAFYAHRQRKWMNLFR